MDHGMDSCGRMMGFTDYLPEERRRYGGGAGSLNSMPCAAPAEPRGPPSSSASQYAPAATEAQVQVRDRKIEALMMHRHGEAQKLQDLEETFRDVEAENRHLRQQCSAKEGAYAVLCKEMDQASMIRAQLQTALQSKEVQLDEQSRYIDEQSRHVQQLQLRAAHPPPPVIVPQSVQEIQKQLDQERNQSAAASQEVARLKTRLADAECAVTAADASAQVTRLREEKEIMRKNTMAACDAAHDAQDATNRLAEKEMALYDISRQKEALEAELRETRVELSRLSAEQKLSDARRRGDGDKVSTEIEELKAKLKNAEAQVEALSEARRKLEEDVQRETDSNVYLRNKAWEGETKITALEAQLEAQSAKFALQLQQADVGKAVEEATRERELELRAEGLAADATGKGAIIQDLQSRHEKLSAEVGAKTVELQMMTAKHADLDSLLQTQTSAMASKDDRIGELQSQMDAQKAEAASKSQQLQALEDCSKLTADGAASKDALIKGLEVRCSELEARVISSEDESKRTTAIARELEAKASGEAIDAAKHGARVQELEAQLMDATAQAELKGVELSARGERVLVLEAEMKVREDSLRDELARVRDELDKQKSSAQDLEAKSNSLSVESAGCAARCLELQASSEEAQRIGAANLREEKERSSGYLRMLREEFARAKAMADEQIASALKTEQDRSAVLAEELASLKNDMASTLTDTKEKQNLAEKALQEESDRHAAEIKPLKESCAKLTDDKEWMESENQCLMQELEEYKNETAQKQDTAVKLALSDKENWSGKVSRLQEELEKVKAEKKMQERVEKEKNSLLQEKDRVETELKLIRQELAGAKTQAEGYASEVASKNLRIRELESSSALKDMLQGQLNENQTDLASVRNDRDELKEKAEQEKAAAISREADLSGEVHRLTTTAKADQDAHEAEVRRLKALEADMKEKLQQSKQAVESLREAQAATTARHQTRHVEEEEAERIRLQCSELTQTLHQLKHENERFVMENGNMKEQAATFEGDLLKISDANAQLAGHQNQNQKIRYMMSLKDEKNHLRQDLEKARSRIYHLESSRRRETLASTLFDAFVSLGLPTGKEPATPRAGIYDAPTPARTPRSPVKKAGPQTPGTSRKTPQRVRVTSAGDELETSTLRPDEAIRRCQLQERQLERISADFAHLAVLVERAVLKHATVAPNADTSKGFAALLQQLRDISAAPCAALSAAPSALSAAVAASCAAAAASQRSSAYAEVPPMPGAKKGVQAIMPAAAAQGNRRLSRGGGTGGASCEASDSDDDIVNSGDAREATEDLANLLLPKAASQPSA